MQIPTEEFEELEQSDFPAFPVVFRPEEETHSNNITIAQSRVSNKGFKMPQSAIKELALLMNKEVNYCYNQLFQQSWQNEVYNINNFFLIYKPLDEVFISGMKKKLDNLQIVRLSSHKVYIGQFIEEKCSGMSIIIFRNGNIYEGMMEQNKRHGQGFYLQSGVGWFHGTFYNDTKTQLGTEVVFRKWAYKGQFQNGLRNQNGLYVENKDISYQGQWKLGIMHGRGTLRTSQSSYQGSLVNSLKHGQGEEEFNNGDKYKGEYQNNRFDGFGTYFWKKGPATYEGTFKNGMRHGKGKWSSGETKYSGNYVQGLKEGYGELYFPSGNFYKGNFVNDKREGYGQIFWTDGSFYKGDWKSGVQNGKGQIYISGGDIVSGIFQNSILVQVIPSIYEKQMEMSSTRIQDLFASNPRLPTTNKTRTFSESKQFSTHGKRRLSKIQDSQRKKSSIKDHIFFQTPKRSSQPPQTQTTGFRRAPAQGKSPASHSQSKSPAARNLQPHGHRHHHGQSGDGRECKCMRRLQNFRMRQKMKTKMNESKVESSLHQNQNH